MTGLQTLAGRLVLGGVAGLAGITLSTARPVQRLSRGGFRRAVCGGFAITRLILFGAVFLVLRISPRGDVPAYYFSEASAVLKGALPYRDFTSSYAPLHGFVDAAVLLVWHSPLALILFAIAIEFLLLTLWLKLGGELFPERDLRTASMLYVTSALSLQFVAIDGQDNVLVALLTLLSLWLAMRSKVVLSGVFIALAAVMVKLIPFFFAPVFFAGVRRRWMWTIGFVAVVVGGYGSFALMHLPLLQPLTLEGPLKSAGTLPYFIETTTGLNFSVRFWNGIMLLVLGVNYLAVWRVSVSASNESRIRSMLWGIAGTAMVLLLFANKSWPAYLVLALFPLCLIIARSGWRARMAFALFGMVALVEHSYWATMLHEASAPELRRAVLRGDRHGVVFLLLEVLLLSGYGWLLWECAARVLDRRADDLDGPMATDILSGAS